MRKSVCRNLWVPTSAAKALHCWAWGGAHAASAPAGVTGSGQEGRAQPSEDRDQGQVGVAYKSKGLSLRQSWLHPNSAASCSLWPDELTSLSLRFLTCKIRIITAPTLQGHGWDSARSSVLSSQHRVNTGQTLGNIIIAVTVLLLKI